MKNKLKSAATLYCYAAILVLNLPFASIHPMGSQSEAKIIEFMKDLHSRGVHHQINFILVAVSVVASRSAQTSQNIKTHRFKPKKEKTSEIKSCAKKFNLIEDANGSTDVTRQLFLQGCDKFLSRNVNKIVKTMNNFHNSINIRYSRVKYFTYFIQILPKSTFSFSNLLFAL